MLQKLKKRSNLKDKFFHLPNIPNPWIIEKYSKNKKINNRIIYVGNISSQINFINIFDSIKNLRTNTKDLHIVLIGSGNSEEELKKHVNYNKLNFVTFLGNLSQEDTLKEISKSEIGIALYNGTFNYDKFRDSCKIREYQALGCIPITTNVVISNTKEINKFNSGIITKNSPEAIKKAIKQIISDKELKKRLKEGCIKNTQYYKTKYEDFYDLIKNA